jgi:RNase P protein component
MYLQRLVKQSMQCDNLVFLLQVSRENSAVERFVIKKFIRESRKLHKMKTAAAIGQ